MNYLSWLIYLANVLENIGPLLVVSGVALIATIVIKFIAYGIACDDYSVKYRGADKPPKPKGIGKLAAGVFALWLLAALCPSKDTVYAIAASQVGEQVLKSPVATKAEKALESWLDKQTSANEKATKDNSN